MALRFKVSGGKVAIFDNAAGDAPLTAPLSPIKGEVSL
jgi:hypothetical protein